jgi:predicted RNA-binding Zn-ribbon protein involved in translation (DUF1610 family)
MSETANCPHCNQKYEITPEYIGTAFKCVDCGKTFVFGDKPQVNQSTSMMKTCPFCGEKVLAVAKKCKHCGEFFDPADKSAQQVNRQTYIWLGILFGNFGVHNFYAKQNGRGAWHLLVQILACIAAANSRTDNSFGVLAVFSLVNMLWVCIDLCMNPKKKPAQFSVIIYYCAILVAIHFGGEIIAKMLKNL